MRDDSVAGDTAIKLVSALDTGSSLDDMKNEKDTRDNEEGALNAENNVRNLIEAGSSPTAVSHHRGC